MPRKPIDYSKVVIYKIVCNDYNITEVYVGSSTDFTRRKYSHKTACNNEKNGRYNLKLYKNIRDNGGWINWRIIEVEKYPCNNKREAEYREEYWRNKLKAELNSYRCWKNHICIYQECDKGTVSTSDYCINHGGGKRCFETDCENSTIGTSDYCIKHGGGKRCIVVDCKCGVQGSAEYCKKHGEQYTCDCGSTLSIKSKNKHDKSKKHQKYLSTI